MAAKTKKSAPVARTEFHLKLTCESDGCYTGQQVAEILRRAAADLAERNPFDLEAPAGQAPLHRALRDVNGNTVGWYVVAEVEVES